jgi:hypothetical protein
MDKLITEQSLIIVDRKLILLVYKFLMKVLIKIYQNLRKTLSTF